MKVCTSFWFMMNHYIHGIGNEIVMDSSYPRRTTNADYGLLLILLVSLLSQFVSFRGFSRFCGIDTISGELSAPSR